MTHELLAAEEERTETGFAQLQEISSILVAITAMYINSVSI